MLAAGAQWPADLGASGDYSKQRSWRSGNVPALFPRKPAVVREIPGIWTFRDGGSFR
jgi:hypothetical protein